MSISLEEIEIKLQQYLAAIDDVPPIAWQNRDVNPVRPFLAVDHVPGPRTDSTIDGYGETVIGHLMIYVVIEGNTFTKPANTLVDAIMVRFKYMTLIPLAEGDILVVKPPEALPGYKDGPDWRVPVRIDYEIQT